MSGRTTSLAGLLVLLTCGAIAVLAGCGGDASQERVDAARRYTGQVAQISTSTSTRLAELSDRADYGDGEAAAESTSAYAAAIRDAAARLRRTAPPASARGLHEALVELYADTAIALQTLAGRFSAAGDPVELAAGAQELSTQVQRYSTREHELRAAIERALIASTTPR